MRTIIATAVALLLAGAANAQTPPAQDPVPTAPANDLTRDLNSGPPAPAVYLAPPPAPAPAPATIPAPTTSAPATVPAPAPSPRAAPITPPAAATPAPTTPRATTDRKSVV